MKKLVLLAGLALALTVVTGCSHNVLTYSDGIGFETTMKPDSGNFGIMFRYGKILSLVARENTEMEMTEAMKGDLDDTAIAATEVDSKVKIKIGTQTTGYDVDLVKATDGDAETIKAFYEGKSRMIQSGNIINEAEQLE